MPRRDLHAQPFDDGTLKKLEIFQQYAREWLPTFLMQSHVHEVCIFDFFAGPGYDSVGKQGSPICILEEVREQIKAGNHKGQKISIYLNEFDKKKFDSLKIACDTYCTQNTELKDIVDIKYSSEDFEVCFNRLKPIIVKYPSLVYLDQNGIKFLSEECLSFFQNTRVVDFLYFVSSFFMRRFCEQPEFMKYMDSALIDVIKASKVSNVHREVTKYLRLKYASKDGLKLYPFSLKKGSNIYGIIFGTSNLRGVEKFLDVAWKANEVNGEADYDIDEDSAKAQLDLFAGKKLTKKEWFLQELENFVRDKKSMTNAQIYEFTLENGFQCSYARKCLLDLRRAKKVHFQGQRTGLNYESWKNNDKPVIITHTNQ